MKTFGKIDNLILKIKERKALIKFMNFESAEKVFYYSKLIKAFQT